MGFDLVKVILQSGVPINLWMYEIRDRISWPFPLVVVLICVVVHWFSPPLILVVSGLVTIVQQFTNFLIGYVFLVIWLLLPLAALWLAPIYVAICTMLTNVFSLMLAGSLLLITHGPVRRFGPLRDYLNIRGLTPLGCLIVLSTTTVMYLQFTQRITAQLFAILTTITSLVAAALGIIFYLIPAHNRAEIKHARFALQSAILVLTTVWVIISVFRY